MGPLLRAIFLFLVASPELKLGRAEELKLGYLYIQRWSSWIVESFTQFKLAINDVNADPTVLPNTTLSFVVRNTHGEEPAALAGAMDLADLGVVGIVGTGYSGALGFPAGFCSVQKLPIVSPGSTLIDLSDKSRYPYLLRSIPSDAINLKAKVVLVSDLGWRAACVIYSEQFVMALSSVLRPALDSLGISYLALALKDYRDDDFKDSTSMVVGLLANSGYRVNIVYLQSDAVSTFAAAAKDADMRSSRHCWIVRPNDYTDHRDLWDSTLDSVMFPFETSSSSNPVLEAFNARWTTVSTLYNESIHGSYNATTMEPFFGMDDPIWDTDYAPVGDGKPDSWGTYLYDVVWLYARAIQAVKDAGGDPHDGPSLRESLLRQNFLGITGQIYFDQESQDRAKQLSIFMRTSQIATVAPLLSDGSPSDEGWCRTGCTSLRPEDVASLPWPTGVMPTDGLTTDAAASRVMVDGSIHEGEPIEVKVYLLNSFKLVPCLAQCAASADGSADCEACLLKHADLSKLFFSFRELPRGVGGNSTLGDGPSDAQLAGVLLAHPAPIVSVSFADGPTPLLTVTALLPDGLPGAGSEDRDVALRTAYGGEVVGGQSELITLLTAECRVGQAGAAGECESCDVGRFASEPGSSECAACPRGREQAERGGENCDVCELGKVASEPGSSECEYCPKGTFTSQLETTACTSCELSLPASTTDIIGARSSDSCVCPSGRYWSRSSELAEPRCEVCPEGLECTTGNGPLLQAAGFQAGVPPFQGAMPIILVRCDSALNCPSGAPLGSCPPLREGVACDKCPVGYWDDDAGGCVECGSDNSALPLLLCASGGVVFLVVLSVYATRTLTVQSHALMTIALSGSLFITAFQTLAAFHQLEIGWIEPMKSLRRVVLLLTFDVDVLNLECVFRSNSPEIKYFCSLTIYPAVACLLLVILAIHHGLHTKLGISRYVSRFHVWNAEGNIIMIVYPSLAMMALMPLRCSINPDGSMSLLSERSILCWDSSEHHVMVVLSILAISFYIVGFMSFVVWVVWKYPSMIVQGGAGFVRQYEFLFIRFKAERYYYCILFIMRNLMMAVIPTLFADQAALQVVVMSLLLILISFSACYLVPWRTDMANALDATIAGCLLIMLSAGALLVPVEAGGLEQSMQVIMMVLMTVIFGGVLAVVGYAAWRFFFPQKRYGMFLSHHKGAAQLLARWFKQRLGDRTSEQVFLDSDNLVDLSTLLNTVAFETKNLVVLLTQETLSRLWCACEVVAASSHQVNFVLLSCDGTKAPDDQYIEELEDSWSQGQRAELASLGVEVGHISDAYHGLKEQSMLTMPQSPRAEIIDQVLLECRGVFAARATPRPIEDPDTVEILVAGSTGDLESACCCQIVQRLLAKATHKATQVVSEDVLQRQMDSATSLVVVLRRGVLADFVVAAAVVGRMQDSGNKLALPLAADSIFRFPDEAFWEDLECGKVIPEFGHPLLQDVPLSMIVASYKALFKQIAVKFTEFGSEAIQAAEISEAHKRLGRSMSKMLSGPGPLTPTNRSPKASISNLPSTSLDNDAFKVVRVVMPDGDELLCN